MDIKFSICLVVKNEEKTLPHLLDSLKEFQDNGGEVCILDTGSTDNTVYIARNYGCVVQEVGSAYVKTLTPKQAQEVNRKFVVDDEEPILKGGDKFFCFNRPRNHVAKMAKNNMILSLDADETVVMDLEKVSAALEVLPILKEVPITRFEHMQVFVHDAEGNSDIEFLQCKFYDRRYVHWENNVHEMLVGQGQRLRLDRDALTVHHWQNPESDRGGYMKGLAVDCFLSPSKDRQCQYFARELFYSGRGKSAEKEFLRHLYMKLPPQEYPTTPTHLDSLLFLGNIYGLDGKLDLELDCYRKAQELDPTNRRPTERIAQFYQWHGNKTLAREWALRATKFPWKEEYGASKLHFLDIINGIINWAST